MPTATRTFLLYVPPADTAAAHQMADHTLSCGSACCMAGVFYSACAAADPLVLAVLHSSAVQTYHFSLVSHRLQVLHTMWQRAGRGGLRLGCHIHEGPRRRVGGGWAAGLGGRRGARYGPHRRRSSVRAPGGAAHHCPSRCALLCWSRHTPALSSRSTGRFCLKQEHALPKGNAPPTRAEAPPRFHFCRVVRLAREEPGSGARRDRAAHQPAEHTAARRGRRGVAPVLPPGSSAQLHARPPHQPGAPLTQRRLLMCMCTLAIEVGVLCGLLCRELVELSNIEETHALV